MFALGEPHLDAALRGGLAHGAVHEVLADPAHPATATGFALALAIRACGDRGQIRSAGAATLLDPSGLTTWARPKTQRATNSVLPEAVLGVGARGIRPGGSDTDIADTSITAARHVVWVRQEAAAIEAGGVYGPGLAAFGIDPARLLLVHLRTAVDVMRAALEATRCASVGAVIIETVDRGAKIDLTATRRLKLAAEKGGVTAILLRAAGETVAGAVETRWRVRPAASRLAQPRSLSLPASSAQQALPRVRSRSGITAPGPAEFDTLRSTVAAVEALCLDAVGGCAAFKSGHRGKITNTSDTCVGSQRDGPESDLASMHSGDAIGSAEARFGEARSGSRPRFDITLMRHRAGVPEMRWQVEWDRDQRLFTAAAALSQPLVPVPRRRSLAA